MSRCDNRAGSKRKWKKGKEEVSGSQTSELKNDVRKNRWRDEAHNKMHTLGSSITKSGTKLRWMLSHEGTLVGS